MDVDIFQLPTMHQQVWPVRRKPTVKRFDGNLNLTDALFAAFHESLFAQFGVPPSSRRAFWKPRLWRFKGENVDPGVLQGGIVETITLDKFADPSGSQVASRFRNRLLWRNRPHASDRVEELQYVPLLFPTWMWLHGPQHVRKWARRRAQRAVLAVLMSEQHLVQTQIAATTSPAFGNMRYTGGRIVVT